MSRVGFGRSAIFCSRLARVRGIDGEIDSVSDCGLANGTEPAKAGVPGSRRRRSRSFGESAEAGVVVAVVVVVLGAVVWSCVVFIVWLLWFCRLTIGDTADCQSALRAGGVVMLGTIV